MHDNSGLSGGFLEEEPPCMDQRIRLQREHAYKHMMGVAAWLLREGYSADADRVLDYIAERKATKLYPEDYSSWLRELREMREIPYESIPPEEELERISAIVAERRANPEPATDDLSWRPSTKTS